MNQAAMTVLARVTSADCYSAGERKWMVLTQNWRGRGLAPLLDWLTRAGVTPDQITVVSVVFGLAAAALYSLEPVVALGCLVLHVLLDGIDGPLARRQQTASPCGSFTDTMADQAVVTAVSLSLMANGILAVLPGGVFVVLYAVVALFAIARNALSRPYVWLVRPRFLFYAWIAVELWLWPGTLGWLVWGCNGLLATSAVAGFVSIRQSLRARR